MLRCVSNLVADSERPLPPLLRLARRAWILGDRSHSVLADRAYRPQVGPVRVRIGAIGRIGALGPAVGNDILCALTWCAALTMGYGATWRFACIFR